MDKLDLINRMIDDATLLQQKMITGQGVGIVAEIQHKLVQLRMYVKGYPGSHQTSDKVR